MDKDIVIRKVNPSDIEKLVALFHEVWPDVSYNKKNKADFVICNSKGINYCAERNGEIVGSRLSFYMNFYMGCKSLSCIQVGDTCTRKDCRGKGILRKLNQAILNDFFLKDNGNIIWNISADAARRVNEKCGWIYINSFLGLVKFARPFHIIKETGFHLSRILGSITWNQESDIIEIDPNLLSKREALLQEGKLFHINYDIHVLEWRLSSNSGIKMYNDSAFGTVLYKIGSSSGLTFVLIGEVFLLEYTLNEFKGLLESFQKRLKPDIIKVAVSRGHPLLPFYRTCHFFYNPKKRFYNHGVRVETDELKKNAFQPQKWAISMLDVDTF